RHGRFICVNVFSPVASTFPCYISPDNERCYTSLLAKEQCDEIKSIKGDKEVPQGRLPGGWGDAGIMDRVSDTFFIRVESLGRLD
ncbi:MAG TPA: hypothetical protein PKJ77_03035, partial [Thermodesulfobacteriota bacterium]|nr:hypothetical protein [Thermodesulfobacteriota bacterium]